MPRLQAAFAWSPVEGCTVRCSLSASGHGEGRRVVSELVHQGASTRQMDVAMEVINVPFFIYDTITIIDDKNVGVNPMNRACPAG